MQAVLDQAVAARTTYLGLQAAVIALMLLKWAYLAAQLQSVQWLAGTLLAVTSPLLHLLTVCSVIAVPVAFLGCIVSDGQLGPNSSFTGSGVWLWGKVRAGVPASSRPVAVGVSMDQHRCCMSRV